jgi:endonuclease/exonuclease/phosphatase family metal-dependent hydrolase
MAFNLERGHQLDRLIAAMESGEIPVPDILLASELDRGCARSGGRHVANELGARFAMDVAFGVEFLELPQERGPVRCEHGNAVLSRFPLGNATSTFHRSQVSWYVPPEDRPAGEPRLGGRSFVSADVAIGDDLLRVVSVHFESEPASWATVLPDQALEAAEAGLVDGPAVVGGDTNIPGYQFDLARDDGIIEDPSAAAIFGLGYDDAHATLPIEARPTRGTFVIDLIFGRGLRFSAPEVCDPTVCDPLSDHEAVWVEIPWPP